MRIDSVQTLMRCAENPSRGVEASRYGRHLDSPVAVAILDFQMAPPTGRLYPQGSGFDRYRWLVY
jgi:hypothetical protein